MAISPHFTTAVGLLQAMPPMEAARVVSSDIDLRTFLEDNRLLDMTPEDIQELKSMFRG